ncbi:hypothetical protein ACIGJO_12175 [Streptomyces sp. NPDC079020]|uniref:hypothetical protein n=1 Tax=Streptomyces sp. NPDC079020 TaxID=3365722 RepID=UPI0037D06F3B
MYGKSGTLLSSSAEIQHGIVDKAGRRPAGAGESAGERESAGAREPAGSKRNS